MGGIEVVDDDLLHFTYLSPSLYIYRLSSPWPFKRNLTYRTWVKRILLLSRLSMMLSSTLSPSRSKSTIIIIILSSSIDPSIHSLHCIALHSHAYTFQSITTQQSTSSIYICIYVWCAVALVSHVGDVCVWCVCMYVFMCVCLDGVCTLIFCHICVLFFSSSHTIKVHLYHSIIIIMGSHFSSSHTYLPRHSTVVCHIGERAR